MNSKWFILRTFTTGGMWRFHRCFFLMNILWYFINVVVVVDFCAPKSSYEQHVKCCWLRYIQQRWLLFFFLWNGHKNSIRISKFIANHISQFIPLKIDYKWTSKLKYAWIAHFLYVLQPCEIVSLQTTETEPVNERKKFI